MSSRSGCAPGIFCAEGIRQAGMLAFPFADARECEKLAERVSHRCAEGIRQALVFYKKKLMFSRDIQDIIFVRNNKR